jgi:hypothetical protein
MSEYEMMQWAGVGAGGLMGAGVLYGLVRFNQRQNAIWPDAAKQYALTYSKKKESFGLGNSRHFERLDGPALSVVSMREFIGNTRRRSTVLSAPSTAWPAPIRFDVERTKPAASFHLVSTNDPTFDRQRFITSPQQAEVLAVLTPAVRAALLQCPQPSLRISCEGAQVVVSFGDLITDAKELTGPIEVALAVAKGA